MSDSWSGRAGARPLDWAVAVEYAGLTAVPWANGLGSTTELVSFEDSNRRFPSRFRRWRLSIARLERPAAFSPLPGVHRSFCPVDAAVELEIDGVAHRIAARETVRFTGDQDVALVSLERACRVVNLMCEDTGPSLDGAPSSSALSSPSTIAAVALRQAGPARRFDLLRPLPTAPSTRDAHPRSEAAPIPAARLAGRCISIVPAAER